MSSEPLEPAETSKAGALRMRRLARLNPLIPPATTAIHRPSGLIIYRATTSTFSGHLVSTFTPSAQPRPLPLPPYLGPGKEISISPTGSWIVIFHPAPSTPSQTAEGGTLAIYSSDILSPLALPTNVSPLASFPLPSDVLAIQHIYLPLPDGDFHSRAGTGLVPETYGPRAPSTYSPSQGPAFLVLTSTGVILFHPQLTGQPQQQGEEPQYGYSALKCPLHTRWYASQGGGIPPDIGRVDRGWAGMVRGDEGVWFGWEDTEEVGLLRAEVIVKDGKASLLSTRMPSLPLPSQSIRRVQGIVFTSVPAHALPSENKSSGDAEGGADVDMENPSTEDQKEHKIDESGDRDGALVGVTVISRTTKPATETTYVQVESHITTYAVQRCEVAIVDAFRDVANGSGVSNAGPVDPPAVWDWFALPSSLLDASFPPSTPIISLIPLYPSLHPRAIAIIASAPSAEPHIVHVDMCPPDGKSAVTAAALTDVGNADVEESVSAGISVPNDLILGTQTALVLSPAAEAGLGGAVGLVDQRKGPVFFSLVSHNEQEQDNVETKGDAEDGMVQDAAKAIVEAVKRGENYADVIGAVLSGRNRQWQEAVLPRILLRTYAGLKMDVQVDEGIALAQLQVALFGYCADARADIALQICRLIESSRLFDECAVKSPSGIGFELDAVWPLVFIAEYVSTALADIFLQVVLYQGESSWSQSDTSLPDPSLLCVLQPSLRLLIIRLLAQLRAFQSFVSSLEKPILQPESLLAPSGQTRDPRATIVAKERIADLGTRDGVDIWTWGTCLVNLERKMRGMDMGKDEDAERLKEEALVRLDANLLKGSVGEALAELPSPSAILMADEMTSTTDGLYAVDGITFQPLAASVLELERDRGNASGLVTNIASDRPIGPRRVRCDRCGTRTESLGWHLAPSPSGMNGVVGMTMSMGNLNGGGPFGDRFSGVGDSQGWNKWRYAREIGCVCGGSWTR